MTKRNWFAIATLIALSFPARAEISLDKLPGATIWYFHVDLKELRSSPAGQKLDEWLRWEVYDEIDDDLGIDLNKEVDRFTAFSDTANGAAIIVEGPVSKTSQDKVLALIATKEPMNLLEHGGKDYYHVGDNEKKNVSNDPFEPFEDTAFFSFALPNKIIITGTEGYMRELLENSGKVSGAGDHNGALMVLSANQSLVQAGIQVDGLIDKSSGDGWESNIVRNTKQAALLVADASGMLAIEAQLLSTDPVMARGIANIVNGLIALQAFNSELPAEFNDLIAKTNVKVIDNKLSINTVIDPELIARLLNN